MKKIHRPTYAFSQRKVWFSGIQNMATRQLQKPTVRATISFWNCE